MNTSNNDIFFNSNHIKIGFEKRILVGILFLLLSYPLFYYSYKFCLPDFGGKDFFAYYLLYKDWDFSKVDSPFNMRLISCFFIFLMNKSSLHYDTETVFSKCYPDFDQQVFFNATLFNYICVVITCIGIYRIVRQVANNELYAFIFGSIYLFGFGTLFFSLKPLTEACGILLLAYAFYHYVKQSNYIYIFLLLSIFQREYTFFAFGIISLIDYYFLRKRYYLFVFVSSVFFFFIYFVLRKTFFFTPHYEFQTSLKTFLNSIIYPDMDWISFLKQSLLISNILIIYFLALVYKKYKRMQINWRHLLITIVLLIHVLLMCIMAKFGNNAGRYFYYTAPIIIFYLSIEMKPLLRNYLRFDE